MKNFIFLLTLLPSIFLAQTPSGPGGVGSSNELEVWLDATKISAAMEILYQIGQTFLEMEMIFLNYLLL